MLRYAVVVVLFATFLESKELLKEFKESKLPFQEIQVKVGKGVSPDNCQQILDNLKVNYHVFDVTSEIYCEIKPIKKYL